MLADALEARYQRIYIIENAFFCHVVFSRLRTHHFYMADINLLRTLLKTGFHFRSIRI